MINYQATAYSQGRPVQSVKFPARTPAAALEVATQKLGHHKTALVDKGRKGHVIGVKAL